jgi:hypothetical protein
MELTGKAQSLSVFGFVLFSIFIFTPHLVAEVPDLIYYQGYLTDTAGNQVPDGTYTMIFTLHTTEDGNTWVWEQTSDAVSVVDGVFNVQLGPFTYPEQVFDGDLYLEMEINGEVLAPRQRLGASAYAMRAVVADSVADGRITNVMIADNAVDYQKLSDNAVNSAKVVNNSLTANDIQDGAVLTEIQDDDGSGSLLDADLLDGMDSADFAESSHDHNFSDLNGTATDAQIPNTITVNYTANAGDADTLDGSHASAFAESAHNHDHGTLTGLSDDDHPQYFNRSQNETINGRPAFNGGTSGSTAPFSVDSTYRVSNLNADLLDGLSASAFMSTTTDKWVDETGDTMSASLSGPLLNLTNSGTGHAIQVNDAGSDGLYIQGAGNDGVHVGEAGNPSVNNSSDHNDGFEVTGAQGNGLFVGHADRSGVRVESATHHGVFVTSADANGVYVNESGGDGVRVQFAGTPGGANHSTRNNGFEVAGAEGHGLYVGHADRSGVRVESAVYNGLYVESAGFAGVQVASGDDYGVYARSTGIAGYFDSPSGIGLVVNRGAVGIGTTDPDSRVSVLGDTGQDVGMDITTKETNYTATLKLCEGEGCVAGMYWQYDGANSSNQMKLFGVESGTIYGPHITVNRETGRVGIGTDSPTDTLTVNGKILAEEIEVVAAIADYVFDDNYSRMSLEELEKYIQEHRHLPGVASEKEVVQRGGTISVGESYTQLLEKVEELTLYIIEQNKKIKELQEVINMKKAG